ncbi:hypothetical protein BX600DRAFT_504486 [Xylariales sp. PMI_506]|nr:hypothetical protein BX600DRAFT_504486 [Xylariales sp. PMI_506]
MSDLPASTTPVQAGAPVDSFAAATATPLIPPRRSSVVENSASAVSASIPQRTSSWAAMESMVLAPTTAAGPSIRTSPKRKTAPSSVSSTSWIAKFSTMTEPGLELKLELLNQNISRAKKKLQVSSPFDSDFWSSNVETLDSNAGASRHKIAARFSQTSILDPITVIRNWR